MFVGMFFSSPCLAPPRPAATAVGKSIRNPDVPTPIPIQMPGIDRGNTFRCCTAAGHYRHPRIDDVISDPGREVTKLLSAGVDLSQSRNHRARFFLASAFQCTHLRFDSFKCRFFRRFASFEIRQAAIEPTRRLAERRSVRNGWTATAHQQPRQGGRTETHSAGAATQRYITDRHSCRQIVRQPVQI